MNEKTLKLIEDMNAYDAVKWDEVAPASDVRYSALAFWFKGHYIQTTDTAIRQLCALNGIPSHFFMERLKNDERTAIFNRLNREHGDTEHMFRFSGDTLYGIVGPRYRRIDNSRILSVIEAAADAGLPLMPVKHTLDPDHTRVVLVPERAQVGELTPSITITNSENGLASLTMWAGVYRWACTNGLMVPVGDVTRSRWFHIGNAGITLPDIGIVLNRSMQYVGMLHEARRRYLHTGMKEEIVERVAGALGQQIAETFSNVANTEYRGAPTLFHAVNALTRTAQSFRPVQQTEIEHYAATLLAA